MVDAKVEPPPESRVWRGARRALLAALFGLCATAVVVAPSSAASAPTTVPPDAAQGRVGLRLLDVPPAAAADPRAQLYIVDHVAPGNTIERRVEVSNTTDAATRVVLYSSAASIADGEFRGADGDSPNDLSSWTSVAPGALEVAPGGTVTATVTITVPVDAAPGEQYGVVWAEVRTAPSTGAGVTEVNRVGIRLYVSVGPGGAPAADFSIDTLTAGRGADGAPTIAATVRNTGGRALDIVGSLELSSGPGGLRAGPFPASLATTLAIGDTESMRIVLDAQLPPGPWDAEITVRSGLLEHTAAAIVTFPASGTAPPVATAPTRSGWSPAAMLGLGGLLVGGAAALFFASRARGVRRRTPTRPGRATEPAPEPARVGL